ncbi:hypothetical protein EV175_004267 [Coemansia sp. RSA 1933]|nr:hypothetical protein EV175_004267 [Coemansia sp. RSA 1933]
MKYLLLAILLGLLQAVGSSLADPEPLNKRIDTEITVSTPAFLITIPIYIASGSSVVSGSASIYYQATRSIKYVGGPGERYLATISVTTYLFTFDYKSSLLGGSIVSWHKDTLYLSRISATMRSLTVSDQLLVD